LPTWARTASLCISAIAGFPSAFVPWRGARPWHQHTRAFQFSPRDCEFRTHLAKRSLWGLRPWPLSRPSHTEVPRSGGFRLLRAASQRPFTPSWDIEDNCACFIVRGGNGQALSYVYYESEPGRRTAAGAGSAVVRHKLFGPSTFTLPTCDARHFAGSSLRASFGACLGEMILTVSVALGCVLLDAAQSISRRKSRPGD
jgi:hypothetical protein